MRYDDLEFAYKAEDKTSRTSTIYTKGMDDTDSEYLVLEGESQDTILSPLTEGFYSLEDYYNSQWPAAPTSKYHESGTEIKDAKFGGGMFPPHQHFALSAEAGNDIDYMGSTLGLDITALTAGSASSPIETFPEPMNVLCGLLHYDAYVQPDEDWLDDEIQLLEDFMLYITIFVKSWKPLVYRRRSKRKSRGWWTRGRRRASRSRRKR